MFPRGTVLTVAMGGASGTKPRPAVVVQANHLQFPDTLVIVPFSSGHLEAPELRPVLLPDSGNGLSEPSTLMTNRIGAVLKPRIGDVIGELSTDDLQRVDRALALVLGLDTA